MGVAIIGLVIALKIILWTPTGLSAIPPSHPSTGTNSPTASTPKLKLTVKVVVQGDGLPLSGSPVKVLQTETLDRMASGALTSALEYAANVPAGQYQVCIDPPIGWASAVRSTQVLTGWVCTAADLRTGPQLVTFRLTTQVPAS